MVDVPGVDASWQLLQDGLDQPALERIELPVRHALPAMPHVDRQQVAGLDLVGDPAARLAREPRVVRHREVVRRLEGLQHLLAFALHLRQARPCVLGHAHGRQPLHRCRRFGLAGRRRGHDQLRRGEVDHRRLHGRLAGDGRQALKRDGQMPAGNLDLILLEQVQAIGPVLHHDATLLDVFGMVVGRADPVRVGMRELGVHPFLRVPEFVQRRRDRCPDAMPRELVLVAHALERGVERVLADRVLQAPVAGDEINLGRLAVVEQVANDLLRLRLRLRLHRQRHDVGRDVDQALALLLGQQLALLEPGHRDDPQAPVEVELIGRGEAQLAGAYTGEHQQPDAQLRVQAPAVLAQRLQHDRQLVHAQERVVFDRRQRQRDHFQVPGRVIAHVGNRHRGVREQLGEPGPQLLGQPGHATGSDAAAADGARHDGGAAGVRRPLHLLHLPAAVPRVRGRSGRERVVGDPAGLRRGQLCGHIAGRRTAAAEPAADPAADAIGNGADGAGLRRPRPGAADGRAAGGAVGHGLRHSAGDLVHLDHSHRAGRSRERRRPAGSDNSTVDRGGCGGGWRSVRRERGAWRVSRRDDVLLVAALTIFTGLRTHRSDRGHSKAA